MDMEELYLFVESQSTTVDNAITNNGVTSDSNDNVLLLGTPNAQTFSGSDTPTTTAIAMVAGNNADATFKTSSVNGPCSNDNPDYAEDTQPCPDAIIFDGIDLDGDSGVDSISSNEFDIETETTTTTTTETLTDGETAALELVGSTIAPVSNDVVSFFNTTTGATTVAPGSDLNDNADVEIVDGNTVTVTGTTTATADDTPFVTSNVDGDTTTFYSCNAATEDELVNSNNSNEAVPFSFNYEIYTPTNVDDVTTVLSTFERQLANGVASSLGLVDCPEQLAVEVAVRSSGGEGRQLMPTRRTLQKWGENNRMLEDSLVVGVSMDPEDELLDSNLSKCTSSATLDTPSECSLISGAMTAWITSAQQQRLRQLVDTDSKDEQETMLLNTVQSYIEQNQDSYLNDDLLHVAYIGQRGLTVGGDAKSPDPVRDTDQNNDLSQEAGMNAGFIGLSVVAVLLALVAVGAVWTYRRRQRRSNQVDEHGLDLEQGAFPGLTPESESYRSYRLNEENDTQDALPPPDEGVAYDNVFGLNGPTSGGTAGDPGDGAVAEERLASPLSSGPARQLSYSPGASPQGSNDEQDVAENSTSFDAAPNTQDSRSFDIAPLSPMSATGDDSDNSVDSSVFEGANEDEVVPAPAVPPSESIVDVKNDFDMLDDTDPIMSEEEDDYGDDSQQSGVLV